jgi:predicted ATPase
VVWPQQGNVGRVNGVHHRKGPELLKRYILTGAPGSGKTSILRDLERLGYPVIEEAATDVIADERAQGHDPPRTGVDFIDKIVAMQVQRQKEPAPLEAVVQIFDRSPLCTLALAQYLGHPITDTLARDVERMTQEQVYERSVLFVRPLGCVAPTAARRISYEDSLRFQGVHESVYRSHGFDIVDIPVADVAERAATVTAYITAWA